MALAILIPGCAARERPAVPPEELRSLEDGDAYRTPRAGEGFRTSVLGRDVNVRPMDRRYISAWDVGLTAEAPGVSGSEVLPFGSLYFWRRPDEDTFFRGVVVGVYNDFLYAKSTESAGPFEGILAFRSLTIPIDQAEHVDGKRIEDEELFHGRVNGGIGAGYRRKLDDFSENDNMFSVSLLARPGYLYFERGHDTSRDFEVPRDVFEGQGTLSVRLNALVKNLLDLPHEGYAVGMDAVYGHRAGWKDWGPAGHEENASSTQGWETFSGYLWAAGGIPGLGERHRLVGSLHGGIGADLDRFSALRLGGGPSGQEYEALARPLLPGAFVEELSTRHYAVGVGEYRFEPIFFLYLSLRGSLAYVDRERFRSDGRRRQDDFLTSIGARITTGFFFETRLQLDYNYGFDVIRHGERGGHEVVAHISSDF